MKISLEDTKGHPVLKEGDIETDTWPDIIFWNGKNYLFKYENFLPDGKGRFRVYKEATTFSMKDVKVVDVKE